MFGRECRELEEMCGVAFTDRLLKGELMWGKNSKEEIRRVDSAQLLDRCDLRAPVIAQVERRPGWARLWDATLDYGVSHTRGLQLLSRVLGRVTTPALTLTLTPSLTLHRWRTQ